MAEGSGGMTMYNEFEMLPLGAFRRECGRVRLYKKDSSPPDYTPVAQASEESNRIMAELGEKQLAFAERQYDESKPLLDEVVRQQMDIAQKSADQGDDYYDYLKSYRPAEQAMLQEAMTDRSGEVAAYDAANKADAATISADDATVYGLNKNAIDAQVGQAVADTQGGYTRALNQAVRQGLRYGASTPGMVGQVGSIGLTQASNIAAAANATRTAGVQDVRDRAATGLQLRQANMGALNKERAINWAKKLDAAGLVKGLPGASTGAYGLAVSAGNSAGQNTLAPGAQYQAGLASGANTIGKGRSLYQDGLGSILDSQTGLSTSAMGANSSTTGAGIGAVAGIAAAAMMSDRRLKRNIVRVGTRSDGLGVYAFDYVWGGGTVIGVMADEVREVYPDAVIDLPIGYAAVDYARI